MAVSLVTADGLRLGVSRGAVALPRVGVWYADLQLVAVEAVTGRVTIELSSSQKLVGTITRSRLTSGGTVRARVVAGGAGLQTLAKAKHYRRATIKVPLTDLARDAGETVSPTIDAAILAIPLSWWTVINVTTGVMVRALAERAPAGTAWRTVADGGIWLGQETWPASDVRYQEVEDDPENEVRVYGLNEPTLLPGTTIGGVKVDRVEHIIGPGEVRAKVWAAK